ncbi:hypothetical protein F5Y16DRAFT_399925 [Xylariaceae sp. FL0255]|nr:hypothetical protein F5Y16DRAFT_399925 [Xylariaceae sp. FL0255]
MADEKVAPTTPVKPTEGDVKFITSLFTFLPSGTPDIDWQKFADSLQLKSAGVARTRFGQIKRKFNTPGNITPSSGSGVGNGTGSVTTTPTPSRKGANGVKKTKTPKAPRGKKAAEQAAKVAAAAAEPIDDDDDDVVKKGEDAEEQKPLADMDDDVQVIGEA